MLATEHESNTVNVATKQTEFASSNLFERRVSHQNTSQLEALNAANFEEEKTKILLHELQLSNQLNQCIHQERRSDFGLMLAMLSDDVREHSQFYLPSNDEQTDKRYNDNELRNTLELPEASPLALTSLSQITSFNQAHLIESNQLAYLRLMNAISPSPIAFRDNDKFIYSDILSNTTLVCQEKYQQYLKDIKSVNDKKNAHDENALNKEQLVVSVMPVLNQDNRIDGVKWLKSIERAQKSNDEIS